MSDVLDRLRKALADRYTIEREIGSGGMATVYHAQDLKHERQVAMKVLRPELAAALGPERFLQEIKIAANLHHPHVLPLYDSGDAEGFLYYVMPLVEGESLRDRLEREKQLAIDDALQIAREVADALSYAHAHGVVHRDIKPENILLESGHAVVADFGIARAVDAAGGERLTETGLAIGTPAYMSPEQAGGEKDLDGRSDLYSLGCVLHEMLAGQPPFTGPTVESLVHQHLSAEAPSVTAIRPSVPGWIAAALERSLAKTPADRFNPVAQFGEAISARTSVTADSRPLPTVSRTRRWFVPGVVAAALLIVLAVVLVRTVAPGPITITLSNPQQVTRALGAEWDPAISPDGSEVVYTTGAIYDYHVVVQDLSGGEPDPLTADRPGVQRWPRWKPDGRSIVFLEFAPSSGFSSHVISRRGGPSTRIRDGGSVWDVHDNRVVYRSHDSLLVRPIDGGEETLVALVSTQMHSITYSPDGTILAYVRGNPHWVTPQSLGNVAPSSIWIVGLDGGDPVQVTDDTTMNVSPAWMPDGRHLLFISDREGQREVYVVEVGPTGTRGEPQSVPGPTDPHSISISADGRRLAYSKFTNRQNIWEIAIHESGSVSISQATPVTEGNQIVETHGLSRDGRWLAFDSNYEGTQDIYVMSVDGGDTWPVTSHPGNDLHPDFSPDGSEIVFYSQRHGTRDVFLIKTDGRDEVPLTEGPGEDYHPSFSPDGLRIAFTRDRSIYVMSRDSLGGQWTAPDLITDVEREAFYSRWSPDGSRIVYHLVNSAQIWTVTLQGEERLLFDGEAEGLAEVYWPDWSTDGRSVYFASIDSTSAMGLYAIPAAGGSPREVVRFDDPTKSGSHYLALTLGHDKVYFTLVEFESDIWVMDLEW